MTKDLIRQRVGDNAFGTISSYIDKESSINERNRKVYGLNMLGIILGYTNNKSPINTNNIFTRQHIPNPLNSVKNIVANIVINTDINKCMYDYYRSGEEIDTSANYLKYVARYLIEQIKSNTSQAMSNSYLTGLMLILDCKLNVNDVDTPVFESWEKELITKEINFAIHSYLTEFEQIYYKMYIVDIDYSSQVMSLKKISNAFYEILSFDDNCNDDIKNIATNLFTYYFIMSDDNHQKKYSLYKKTQSYLSENHPQILLTIMDMLSPTTEKRAEVLDSYLHLNLKNNNIEPLKRKFASLKAEDKSKVLAGNMGKFLVKQKHKIEFFKELLKELAEEEQMKILISSDAGRYFAAEYPESFIESFLEIQNQHTKNPIINIIKNFNPSENFGNNLKDFLKPFEDMIFLYASAQSKFPTSISTPTLDDEIFHPHGQNLIKFLTNLKEEIDGMLIDDDNKNYKKQFDVIEFGENGNKTNINELIAPSLSFALRRDVSNIIENSYKTLGRCF
jgi:hypothetical protein